MALAINGTGNGTIGNLSVTTVTGNIVSSGDSGTVVTDMIADSNITPSKLNGGQSGSAPIYGVRAHCLFNGIGTVSVTGGGNVSSITDLGTGNYRVNFTTAMPSTAFTYAVSTRHQGGQSRGFIMERSSNRNASYFEIEAYDLPNNNNGFYSSKDVDRIGVIIVHQ